MIMKNKLTRKLESKASPEQMNHTCELSDDCLDQVVGGVGGTVHTIPGRVMPARVKKNVGPNVAVNGSKEMVAISGPEIPGGVCIVSGAGESGVVSLKVSEKEKLRVNIEKIGRLWMKRIRC